MTRDEYILMASTFNKRGESCHSAKLTEHDVRAIRSNKHGLPAKMLAKKYGVHKNTIDRIRWRQNWGHVL